SLCVFNDTATTYIYTLSLHDALPILVFVAGFAIRRVSTVDGQAFSWFLSARSEEHTSELQSLAYLVCRFLLGKKIQYAIDIRTELTHTCGALLVIPVCRA